jgi:hypothetical protein
VRTQVGIVGGGPAGLLLSHLLHLEGIESIVLERRSREVLETTVRAGVLEHGTAELLKEVGVGERMRREGSVHHGIELRFGGRGHRIDFGDLTEGLSITIYGQQEVVKDLIRARLEADGKVLFEARAESVGDLDTDSAEDSLPPGWPARGDLLRLRGRLRRLTRGLQDRDPGERAHTVHQNLSLWVVRHPRPGTAIDGGVDLHSP